MQRFRIIDSYLEDRVTNDKCANKIVKHLDHVKCSELMDQIPMTTATWIEMLPIYVDGRPRSHVIYLVQIRNNIVFGCHITVKIAHALLLSFDLLRIEKSVKKLRQTADFIPNKTT